MHINLLLPFLLLSSPFALSKPAHGKRSTHLEKNFNPLRRIQEPLVKIKRKNGKRVLKKKKRACQVPVTANVTLGTGSSTSASSYPASSSIASIANASSVIGGNNWATPSSASAASASASASASIASAAASASASATTNSNSDWNLVETVSGSNFFDAWNFWSYDDPTHGTVDYVDSTTAWNENLISINNAGNAIMTVDTTEQVSNGRKAVRIHANRIWTGGLVLMDAVHMPTGCGTWPAWWMNGPNWPNGGEIDILEGVNAFSENQVSLHTGDGCTMPSSLNSGQTGQLTTGSYDSYNCASYATSNQGCGVRAVGDESSYGPGFNSIGGGVYARKSFSCRARTFETNWDSVSGSIWRIETTTVAALFSLRSNSRSNSRSNNADHSQMGQNRNHSLVLPPILHPLRHLFITTKPILMAYPNGSFPKRLLRPLHLFL